MPTSISPDGQTQTTTYPDGSVSVGPAPGSTTATRLSNGSTMADKAAQAVAANITYINLAAPSTAQNTAEIKALAKQVNALIKLHLGLLDDTTGT